MAGSCRVCRAPRGSLRNSTPIATECRRQSRLYHPRLLRLRQGNLLCYRVVEAYRTAFRLYRRAGEGETLDVAEETGFYRT
jgi:hypothetical protein